MAIVSVDSSTNHLQLEAIPLLDVRLLSQTELNSLSLCSDEAFDLHRCDDVVIPKIDRSVFNESAGSRKQTYSRLRLAPRKPEITNVGRRRRSAGLLPLPKPPPNPVDDPERKENERIAILLRELFVKDSSVKTELIRIDSENGEPEPEPQPQPVPLKVDNGVSLQQFPVLVACREVKKRGRKRKHELKPPQVQGDGNGNLTSNAIVVYENELNAKNQTMDFLNRNDVAVDIAALAKLQDPFGPELRRRSIGLVTEPALLGFLKDLKGQWGSRRKKRKIVDASDFGDALPKGWKLLVALKRREGRVSLNCRRYISPNGHQFVTCKEVSSFLLSNYGPQNAAQQNFGHIDRKTQQTQKLASESTAGLSTSLITSQSNDHEKQVALLGVENLAEVQVRDLLECQKCNMTFEEKDAYLQHLLSSHQRRAKRCRRGSSVTDGVIVKDGKYECQFCHKIFEERHRYVGHVGVHVRNSVKNLEALPAPITVQKSFAPSSSDVKSVRATPDGTNFEWMISSSHSKQVTGAGEPKYKPNVASLQGNLVKVARKECRPETSAAKPDGERNAGSFHTKLKEVAIQETPIDESNFKSNVGSCDCKLITEASKDCVPKTESTDGSNVGALHNKQGETPTGKPSSDLTVISSHNGHDMEANKFEGTLVEKSYDILCCDSTVPDSRSGMTDEANDVGNDKISNYLDSGTALSNQRDRCTSETFDGNDSSAVASIEDKCDIEPERPSGSCLLIPGNEQSCVLEAEVNMNVVSTSFTVVQSGNNEIESGSGGCDPGPYKDVITEATWASGEENGPESWVADFALPLMHSAGCNDELGSGFGGYDAGPNKDVVMTADEGNVPGNAVADSSLLMQSSGCYPDPNMTSDKAEIDSCNIKNLENMSGFEELRLDHIEPSRFSFMTPPESRSLPEESVVFPYNAALEQVDSTVQFEWEAVYPRLASTDQLSTICILCRSEFNHGAVECEMQSDSLGFMCPACKNKVSGQVNGLPMNSDKP